MCETFDSPTPPALPNYEVRSVFLTFGSDPSNDVFLLGSDIAKFHARFTLTESFYVQQDNANVTGVLYDYGTLVGTFLKMGPGSMETRVLGSMAFTPKEQSFRIGPDEFNLFDCIELLLNKYQRDSLFPPRTPTPPVRGE